MVSRTTVNGVCSFSKKYPISIIPVKNHPFAPVHIVKNARYYVFWTVSLLVAPVLFPIRLVISLFGMLIVSASSHILTRGVDVNQPMCPWRRTAI